MRDVSDRYSLQDSLGYQITLLSRINERLFEQRLAPLGLTRITWCVLLAVHQEKLVNPSEIAAYIGIDRTATSRALRRLEADGLIARAGGAADRRTTEVSATLAGATRLAKATTAARTNAERFADKLSRYERLRLIELIDKLMAGEQRNVKGL